MLRGLLLILLAMLLNYLSAGHTQLTEKSYSLGVYQAIAPLLSKVTGIYPYSLAEIIVVLLAGLLIWRLLRFFRCLRGKEPSGKLELSKQALLKILLAGGIVYFSFLLLWGFNYNRISIATITGLEVKPSSVRELIKLSQSLAQEVNQLRSHQQEDASGVMFISGGYRTVLKRASLGYESIAKAVPELSGSYGPPKPIALSPAMSYTGIWGIYFPFTAEANVNVSIPEPFLAFTTAHEMAHQRGFAREDEANYIAYLVCRSHPDSEFSYSGSLMAYLHVSRALAQADLQSFKEISGMLSPGVKRDLLALEEFNKRHENPLERFSLKVNDLYLKANRQKDGEHSYGQVVDLLLAEYRARSK